MRIVITGHVDHGKSTVIGRLLADTHSLPQGKLDRIRAYCERNGKTFEYAFLLDALKDEQSQGITIGASRVFFKTALRDYLIIDAPGHMEFLKNMVSGASQASAALLVVDAQEGIRENTRRHGYLLSMLGIRQIAVLINKMDLAGYGREVFQKLKKEFSQHLERIGVRAERFIPVAALQGDNVASRSARMPWYEGPTVVEVLDSFTEEPSGADGPFRMPVQDVYKFSESPNARRAIVGVVESGTLDVGEEVVFYPSGKTGKVASVEEFPAAGRTRLNAGQAASFSLAEELYVKRGEIAAKRGERAPRVSTRMKARLIWLGNQPLSRDKDYILKTGTARVSTRIEEICLSIDTASLEPRPRAEKVRRHEAAECLLRTSHPIAFDTEPGLGSGGRFVLVDEFAISGGGLIKAAVSDDADWVREKALVRSLKWQNSAITRAERERFYRQSSAWILVTGPRESNRKEVAKALEATLFREGRAVYFLGFGSALYGVNTDIRDADNHPEDIRRLAEVSHILLDAGLLLVVSAAEFSPEDLEIVKAVIDPDRIQVIWVGDSGAETLPQGVWKVSGRTEEVIHEIRSRLRERGWLDDGKPGMNVKPNAAPNE